MHEPLDINRLLAHTAQADNAALPFAQWKQALLEKASSYEGPVDAPLDIAAFIEKKKRPKRALYRITGAVAGVAAVFIILLSVNGRFSGGNAPAPAPMEIRQFAAMDEESAMDSTQRMHDGLVQEPELAAPQAAAPESPMLDAGGGESRENGANELGPITGQASPMMLDPLIDEAIRAVVEALSADALNENLYGGALPYAYQVLGGSFTITPLSGGGMVTITLDTAYIVEYPDASAYLVKPLDAGGVEVLGMVAARDDIGND